MQNLKSFLSTYNTADAATYGKEVSAIATARAKFASNYMHAADDFEANNKQNKIVEDVENAGCYAIKLKYGTRNLNINEGKSVITKLTKQEVRDCIENLHALTVAGELDDMLKEVVDEIAARRM